MKSFRELAKYFKDIESIKIERKDQVLIYNNEIVYIYLSKNNLKNPDFIVDTLNKYKSYKQHIILTYVGFSPKLFKMNSIDINFDVEIDVSDLAEICCLGLLEFRTSLLYLKKIDEELYNNILIELSKEIKKKKMIYKAIPYGLEMDTTIYNDLKKLLSE